MAVDGQLKKACSALGAVAVLGVRENDKGRGAGWGGRQLSTVGS